MNVIEKSHKSYSKFEPIYFKGQSYIPDYIVKLPIDNKESVNIDNSDCVFLIYDPCSPEFRKYIAARHFRKSEKDEKIPETINGYKPQYIFCFTQTYFPLTDFIEAQDLSNFQIF